MTEKEGYEIANSLSVYLEILRDSDDSVDKDNILCFDDSVDGYDSDNPPDEVNMTIKYSPLDLIELLEQRLENEPQGIISHKQWRKDVNRMIDELENVYGIKTWKKV